MNFKDQCLEILQDVYVERPRVAKAAVEAISDLHEAELQEMTLVFAELLDLSDEELKAIEDKIK